MGADKAVHVLVEPNDYPSMQPIHVSKILAKLAQDEKIDILLVGKQVGLFLYLFEIHRLMFMPEEYCLHVNFII